ncbi:MAG: type II secretion system F family protein [Microthrixaceae bacterium]
MTMTSGSSDVTVNLDARPGDRNPSEHGRKGRRKGSKAEGMRFRYAAEGLDGEVVRGEIRSISPNSARNELAVQGLRVLELTERKGLRTDLIRERVPRAELMHFCRQMAIYLSAGVPVVEAIDELRIDTKSNRLRTVLGDGIEKVSAGVPLADALAEHDDIAPAYFIAILRSAELTGRMDTAFEQLSTYLERDLELTRQVRKALIYPIILFCLAMAVCLLMVIFAIPRFAEFFEGFDAELPLPTRMLMGVSDFVQSPLGAGVGIVMAGAVVGALAAIRTPPGRRKLQQLQLRTPVLSNVVRYAASERFTRVLAALIEAGVALPTALPTAIESCENAVFAERLGVATDGILAGEGFADPLAETQLFNRTVIQMIRVGERTGDLGQQLDNAAGLFKAELSYSVQKLTAWFEPMITIFIGIVVGFVALAMVSAMYGIYSQVQM